MNLKEQLKELKENWISMGKQYEETGESHTADVYHDCANDLHQLLEVLKEDRGCLNQ